MNNGATLGGTGATGAVTVAAGGALAPGNSPGILTTGNLSFTDNRSALKIEIGGTTVGTQYDQVQVNGTVNLAGATLNLTFVSAFTPTARQSFTIISNDGTDAVTGTFAGLADHTTVAIAGSNFTVNYEGGDGNDVVLTANATAINNLTPSVNYTEAQPFPVTLSPSTTVTAPAPSLLTSAIEITDFQPGDILAADTTGFSDIASYDPATGTLRIYGVDTLADYQQILQTISFSSTSHDPTAGGARPTANISWQIFDSVVPSGPLYQAPTTYATHGTAAQSSAVGDFNGDGFSDLAVANGTANDVSILLGNGAGAFGPAANITLGTNVSSVATGDFNADTRMDLVVTNKGTGAADGSVSVLLGNGNGTFAAPINAATGLISPTEVVVGDFSGSLSQDIAYISNGAVKLQTGTGAGTFNAATTLTAGVDPDFIATGFLASASVRPDFAVANFTSNTVSIFLNNAGVLTPAAPVVLAGTGPTAIAIANFDAIAGGDFAVADSTSDQVEVFLGNGTGSFVIGTPIALEAGAHPTGIVASDIDGDGIVDLVVTDSGTNHVAVLLGDGSGNFQTPIYFAAGTSPTSLALGDFNRDGNIDLAATTATGGAGNVSVLLHSETTPSAISTTQVIIAAVNDAPVNTVPVSLDANENDVAVPLAGFSISDDASQLQVTFTVQHGTLHVRDNLGGGFLGAGDITNNDTASVTLLASKGAVNATLQNATGLVYTPDTNFHGADQLTMLTSDLGTTGTGGIMTDSDNVTITVHSIITTPVLTGLDPLVTFPVNAFAVDFQILDHAVSFTDAGDFVNGTLIVSGLLTEDFVSVHSEGIGPGQIGYDTDTQQVSYGGVVIGSASGGVGGTFSVLFNANATGAAVDRLIENLDYYNSRAEFFFEDSSNPAPTPSRNFQVAVTNGSGHSTGNHQITVNIGPVDTAPVATNGAASGNEDTVLSSAVVATDAEANTLTYTLVGTNGGAQHGTVALNSDGTFNYTPVANFNGPDSFSFMANDGFFDFDVGTESIIVNPVNDAPVNTVPGAQSVNEDTNLVIGGLAIADVDAAGGLLTTTLSVAHGTLTAGAAGGAAVSGSGGNSITLTGTVAQINTTLSAANNVIYRGVLNYNGPDTLTVVTNDGGNTGGGALTDTDTVAITVNAVNDAPVAAIGPTNYIATEQTVLNLKNAGISVSDVDGGPPGSETVTLWSALAS